MRILVAAVIISLVLGSGFGSAVQAGCPAVSEITRIHDGGKAVERFLRSPAYAGIGALAAQGMDTSDAWTYLSRSGEVVVLLPLVSKGEVVGAVAYSIQRGVAVACHSDASGRLVMTYADNQGYAWTRYWNTEFLSDATALSDSSCVHFCATGCSAVCTTACVGTGPGYLACVFACAAACWKLCENMCEGEGGGGGGGSEPPAANSIP